MSCCCRTSRRLHSALILVLLAGVWGCGKESAVLLPTTHTVAGQIVDKSGRPLTFGAVEFVSMRDEKVQAIGKVNPDGTFSLMTVIGKDSVPGAVEGPHRVTFMPSMRGQAPHYFPDKCEVRPGDNRIKLTYPYAASSK